MRTRYFAWAGALLGIVGCAPTASVSAKDESPRHARAAQQIFVQVRQQLKDAEEWLPLAPEESLHLGDQYQLIVQTTAPAFLYVGRASAGRPVELLLPKAGTSAPLTTEKLVLPMADKGYVIEGPAGDETLYIVSAEKPLPEAVAKQHFGAAPLAESGKDRDRPPKLTDKNRGPTPFYVSQPIAAGIVGLKFTFQHQN